MNHHSRESQEPRRLLIVDDEPLILRTLASVATAAGYEVGTAPDGLEGLIQFRQGDWDVVVTDRNMPVMDGGEMTRAIKKLSPSTPVILVTAQWGDVEDADQYQVIMEKPFVLKQWLAAVERACARKSHASAR